MKLINRSTKLLGALVGLSALNLPGFVLANEMPVYHVVENGIDAAQAIQLAKSLNVNPELIDLKRLQRSSELHFLDVQHHQSVPTRILGSGKPDEERKATVAEALDFDAIAKLRPVDGDIVLRQLQLSLREVGKLPEIYKPQIRHTRFEAVDKAGNPMVNTQIDTHVSLDLFAADIPLVGPGAKIAATIGADGMTTRLQYANRELKQGETVPVIGHAEAQLRCEERLLNNSTGKNLEAVNVTTNMVYYSPSLDLSSVKTLQPHYDCGGTAVVDGEIVNLLHELVPAVVSVEYVPELLLDAKVDGREVTAQVHINGGLPPYAVEWSAKNIKPLNRTGTLVTYTTQPREASGSEVVTVKVTDANGVETLATTKVSIVSKPVLRSPTLLRYLGKAVSGLLDTLVSSVQAVGGVTDYGTENAVTNEFGDLEQGFIDRMQNAGVTERFSWSGTNAWEQDFKATEDSNWIDNTDITFYVGHGYGGGFTFEDSSHDDGTLDYNDATEDWGDKDLEWLALLSCQVLKDDWSGMSRFDRWKQEFDGLHMLLGFHTNAYAWMSFSGEFADNMLKSSPMSVRTAWFEATDTNQPNGVVPVVMGVFGNSGESNMNDYFWGKGSVGPDIRDGSIGGYWSITVF
ncbi:MAG: DUF6345 domain-containing protein [Gammaproteobacteria bacterium]|nr:DUF6345 domain-containing protein [Gammaproteobacteria bacterium]